MIESAPVLSETTGKMGYAAKWSLYAEFAAKMIVPVTNMVLARIFAPSIFGLVATVNMIVSFIDMITAAGFQRYLVQHDCENTVELHRYASVAFWTNLFLSVLLGAVASVFIKPITSFVGSTGYEKMVLVAFISLPITSFSCIQEALYKRNLEYKTLFVNRLIVTLLPFIITIPLALLGFSYWSLLIGTIGGNLAKAIHLTVRSDWKPNLFFNFALLGKMLSFSIWSLLETIANWATFWIDVLVVSNILGGYFTGLYRTSQVVVSSIISIITGATTTVLFSSLSRTKNNKEVFLSIFLNFQKHVAILVLPMGVGIFLFSDWITVFLLGSQWMQASAMIGAWGLCSSLVAVYGAFCREAYISQGRPRLSLLVLLLHLGFVIPVCIFSAKKGFEFLVYARSFSCLQIILIHFIFMKLFVHISPIKMLKNTFYPLACSLMMGALAILLKWLFISMNMDIPIIIVCTLFYFLLLSISREYRLLLMGVLKKTALTKVQLYFKTIPKKSIHRHKVDADEKI